MSDLDVKSSASSETDSTHQDASHTLIGRWPRGLRFSNIGAVYVLIVIIIVFGIITPSDFLTMATVESILNTSAISCIVALALLIPLASGVFDLSIGAVVGMSGMTVAWLFANHPSVGLPWALLAGIGVALCIGIANTIVVVWWGVSSFIGTLATGGIVTALAIALTNGQSLTVGIAARLGPAAKPVIDQITLPVFYALGFAIVLGFLFDYTPLGRRLYAMGFNLSVARLIGVRTTRLFALAFVSSALLAGIAGIVLTAQVQAAAPQAGDAYLIPAFSAAFLGATQFRRGRFNPWGTILAVILLNTGSTGLLLAAAPTWSVNLFQGVVLIAAVALTRRERSSS